MGGNLVGNVFGVMEFLRSVCEYFRPTVKFDCKSHFSIFLVALT